MFVFTPLLQASPSCEKVFCRLRLGIRILVELDLVRKKPTYWIHRPAFDLVLSALLFLNVSNPSPSRSDLHIMARGSR